MWEVRAAPGQTAELLEWVLSHAPAAAQVYASADGGERVVVVDPSGRADVVLEQTPTHLVAREPHAWKFTPMRNV
jgi:hypothetical protein